MNVAHLLPDCLPSSTSTVYTSVFSSPQFANSCTCHRPLIMTMTDHHCQHRLKKKQPSSPCVLRSCSTSLPGAAVIAAYQAKQKSTPPAGAQAAAERPRPAALRLSGRVGRRGRGAATEEGGGEEGCDGASAALARAQQEEEEEEAEEKASENLFLAPLLPCSSWTRSSTSPSWSPWSRRFRGRLVVEDRQIGFSGDDLQCFRRAPGIRQSTCSVSALPEVVGKLVLLGTDFFYGPSYLTVTCSVLLPECTVSLIYLGIDFQILFPYSAPLVRQHRGEVSGSTADTCPASILAFLP